MRKTTFLLLAILLATFTNAQTYFSENFEGGALPADWAIETNANDGGYLFGTSEELSGPYWPIPDGSGKIVATNDDACNCDKSNDMLITPAIDFTEVTNAVLRFDYVYIGSAGESVAIKYTTDDGTTWNTFGQLEQKAMPGTDNEWSRGFIVYLGEVLGKSNVKLAFIYSDGGDWGYGFALDNVMIYKPSDKTDMAIESTDVRRNHRINEEVVLKGIMHNAGTDTIQTVDLKWKEGSDTYTQTLTDLALPPMGYMEFEHEQVFVKGAPGKYAIELSIEKPNGGTDPYSSNNMVTLNVGVWQDFIDRTVLVEEFSTEKCQYCPPVGLYLKEIDENEEQVIMLVHHAGFGTDKFTIPENNTMLAFYKGGTFAPAAMMDRHYNGLANDGDEVNPGPVFWPGNPYGGLRIEDRLQEISMLDVNISGFIDKELGIVKVKVAGEFIDDYTQELGVSLWAKENDIVSNGQAGWTGEWTHHAVARAAISSTLGDAITTSTNNGDSYSKTYIYTYGLDWELENTQLVGFVNNIDALDVNNRTVQNSTEIDILDLAEATLKGISFVVTENGIAVKDAVVTINDEVDITNVNGEADFVFPSTETVSYTVEYGDYEVQTGTVEVAGAEQIDIDFSTIGVNYAEQFAMQLFPNPTKGDLTVKAQSINHVSIFTLDGKKVLEQVVDSLGETIVSLSDLDAGIYAVMVQTANGQRIERIVKE